ncbi:MAG: DNA repair protein RecN [Eubacteriaceae bacterium]
MLRNLVIRNYALIKNLRVDFHKNLNVITGETGAGKSIVIDALSMVLGNRGNKSNIRQGETKVVVQGLFDIENHGELKELCQSFGIPIEDDQLILTREMDDKGRNLCQANGLIIPVAQLKKIGENLLDIHGQHEHQSLFKRDHHRELLDAFGGEKNKELRFKVEELALEIKILKEKIDELEVNEQEIEREKETLQFEIKDIESANLVSDEDATLEDEKRILDNKEKLFSNISEAYEHLRGENTGSGSVIDALSLLQNNLIEVTKIDNRFEKKLDFINDFASELENLSFEIRGYLEDMEYSLGDLDEIESRLALISRLKRKYGNTIEEIITYGEEIKKRYEVLAHREENLNSYYQRYKEKKKEYIEYGKQLHDLREKSGIKLKEMVEKELKDLAMEKANFQIDIQYDQEKIQKNGQDTVEFLISVNPGQDPKPLGKVASGGEISRIMLSIKSIFSGLDNIDTMVFDEIDTGISGRTAQVVAEKIQALSVTPPLEKQIICITHLPQIAAMADQHFCVEKFTDESTVDVKFVSLDERGKKEELARMLGGAEVTQKTWEHAQEMLELSKKLKKAKKIKESKILH